MLHTEKTDQAYKLLKSYAHTPEQKLQTDAVYVEALDADNEDTVIIAMLGYILDGLRFGNWLWDMPPNAKTVKQDADGESRSPRKDQF
jgi:hypothetical protein